MTQAKDILILILSWLTGIAFIVGGVYLIIQFETRVGIITLGGMMIPAGVSVIAYILHIEINWNYKPHKEEEIKLLAVERNLRSQENMSQEQINEIICDIEEVLKENISRYINEAIEEVINTIANVESSKELSEKIEQIRKSTSGTSEQKTEGWTDEIGAEIKARSEPRAALPTGKPLPPAGDDHDGGGGKSAGEPEQTFPDTEEISF